MPVYDYACPSDHIFEVRCSIAARPDLTPCPECGADSRRVILTVPPLLTEIIPSYPGSKKLKAGYVHSHGDKAATKVSSGYGGCVNPRTNDLDPIAKGVIPEPPKTPQKRLAS